MKSLAALFNPPATAPVSTTAGQTPACRSLWICIHLPWLAMDTLQLQDTADQAFVIYTRKAQKTRVQIASAKARAQGIESGMQLSAAHALCADLQTHARNRLAEKEYLLSLTNLCNQFSPTISLQYADAIQIEISSSLALFGGLDSILNQIRSQLDLYVTRHTIAVSPTAAASHVLASAGQEIIVLDRPALRSALGKCPLHAFPFEPRQLAHLQRLGLHNGHDLLRLPTAELARRFGPELSHSLHILLGIRQELPALQQSPAHFCRQIELPFDTEQHTVIMLYLRTLLQKLITFLIQQDASVSAITFSLYHSQQIVHRHTLHCNGESRQLKKWLLLFEEHLHPLTLANSINRIQIETGPLQPYAPPAQDLLQPQRCQSSYSWQETLDQIKARLGSDCLYAISYRAHHCPEQAHVFYQDPTPKKSFLQDFNCFTARPIWLLAAPQKLHLQNGQLRLRHNRLRLGNNVERIESGWWEKKHIRRDYHIAADARHRLHWIFHDLRKPGDWFLHGYFS